MQENYQNYWVSVFYVLWFISNTEQGVYRSKLISADTANYENKISQIDIPIKCSRRDIF